MVSKDKVICPFCKHEHGKTKALGTSGLICYAGQDDVTIVCERCGKEFICDTEVTYKFKTRKYY